MPRRIFKKELSREVCKAVDLPPETVEEVIEELFNEIAGSLMEGDYVIIKNFGRFYIFNSKREEVYDINKKTFIKNTKNKKIKFVVSKGLREKL